MRRAAFAALATVALAVAACGDSKNDPAPTPTTPTEANATSEPSAYVPPALAWERCGDSFTCADLPVPLDYASSRGETIDLALIRQEARLPERRIGALLLNFGGPGASGVEAGRYAPQFLPTVLLDRFDIIGFDPRGVGESAPVDCGDDFDAYFALDSTPDDDDERQALIDAARNFAADCQSLSGDILPHVGTVNAARDMDVIRQALGEKQISYLGYSYGTLLGAVYADLFPDRVRAFVLDGAVDPERDGAELTVEQSRGFEDALTSFFAWCAADTTCPFNSGGDPAAAYDAVMAAVELAPIPDRGGDRTLGPGEAQSGVASALYDRDNGWPALARALTDARGGDGGGLLALFGLIVGREPDGSYSNLNEANAAVNCIDSGEPNGDIAPFDALYERLRRETPRIGASSAYLGLPCAFWPADATPIELPLDATGAAPILVIGTLDDPVTPHAWAEGLASQLESATLLSWRGEEHTAFGGKSACIDDTVVAYFVRLELPADRTICH